MKFKDCRWADDDGRPLCTPWTKNGRQKSQIETVKRREIGCPFSGAAYDKELLFQKKVFGNESPRAAKSEQSGKCGQNVGEKQE